MIDIEVILPDGHKETGTVDPSASFDEIKADMVAAFDLGDDPSDFEILMVPNPRAKRQSLQNFKPSTGDVFVIQRSKALRGKAFARKSGTQGP